MSNYRHTTPDENREGSTLTHQVYTALREEILNGKLKPGERLARHSVSSRLGVSRMPVTEALMRLEQDGLVESKPMVGARVPAVTLETLRNDQVLREALECQSARLASEFADDAELLTLRKKADEVDRVMEQGAPDSRLGATLDVQLHLRLARAGGSPVLAEGLERIFLRRMMRLNWIKGQIVQSPERWHAQLIDTIASRDVAAAESAMRAHVRFRRDMDEATLEADRVK